MHIYITYNFLHYQICTNNNIYSNVWTKNTSTILCIFPRFWYWFNNFKNDSTFQNQIITHMKSRSLSVPVFYQIFFYMLMINFRCIRRGTFYFRSSKRTSFIFVSWQNKAEYLAQNQRRKALETVFSDKGRERPNTTYSNKQWII